MMTIVINHDTSYTNDDNRHNHDASYTNDDNRHNHDASYTNDDNRHNHDASYTNDVNTVYDAIFFGNGGTDGRTNGQGDSRSRMEENPSSI